jgi:hypothetical protein
MAQVAQALSYNPSHVILGDFFFNSLKDIYIFNREFI